MSGALSAQTSSTLQIDPDELINYAYVLDSGLGSFSVSGRSVQTYRIPISYTLRSIVEHPWGLKLTFPVSFGFHDLRAVIAGDDALRANLRTVVVTPGVEFQFPAGRAWLLKPFAEVGFGKEISAGGDRVLVYSTGVRALLERPRGRYTCSFGAGAKRNGVSGIDGNRSTDELGIVEAGVDFRFPLGVDIAGRPLDASVFLVGRRFVSSLVFEQIGQPPIEIESQYEVGTSFGTDPPIRIWGVKLPRIGLSYRTGDDLVAYRINFGFPF